MQGFLGSVPPPQDRKISEDFWFSLSLSLSYRSVSDPPKNVLKVMRSLGKTAGKMKKDPRDPHELVRRRLARLSSHQGYHATTRFLEEFMEGSSREVLFRRILRRCLVVRVLRGGVS